MSSTTSDLDFDTHRRKFFSVTEGNDSIGSTGSFTYPVNKSIHARHPKTSYAHTPSDTECLSIRGRPYSYGDDSDFLAHVKSLDHVLLHSSPTESACNNEFECDTFSPFDLTSSKYANDAIPNDHHLEEYTVESWSGGSVIKQIQGRHFDSRSSTFSFSDVRCSELASNGGIQSLYDYSDSNPICSTLTSPDEPCSELARLGNVGIQSSHDYF